MQKNLDPENRSKDIKGKCGIFHTFLNPVETDRHSDEELGR